MSLNIDGLSLSINGRTILDQVDLQVKDGQRVGLIGSSGSGKSMIARSVLGTTPLTASLSGSILVDGLQILGSDDRSLADLRGSRMGMIFQNPSTALNPVKKIYSQVELPLRRHYRLSAQERRRRVMEILAQVGLDADLAGSYPHELSGGQQQRAAIATALVTKPRLILADEPTTALDAITQRQIVDLLVSLVDQNGASLLFITHDFSVLAQVADYCYILDAGRVVESGQTQSILRSPSSPQGRTLVRAARELTLSTDGGKHEAD
ncbi:ABC transporter ATP-binding protein [Bifidobacterium sp. B4081]|uniref:ABC transporter ATP-binding protein n=1 Tax=unclassified Bifidobacterium TaxID=2608897 RepID=UPI00226AB146|nr:MULTISPECIES: ABC transporter ATP-binding protein [unclassified Bifidobacterium]MCX8643305.1 ABC transporter ATP-binding protein [Bifidobacterium sp. B4077]MCX8645487.1 ABC transporter ATP-binding protein [Bifidobacterium sp. B4081]MCX8647058.1 ABC transporter ATP-binding protein [Bifidobacterium sp. B4107]MCX8651238.1 ABC transporter ATP-binding protein [Bifidobacterium sp. B4111]MCX8657668.1 ABC transporter ATP-binding protein [Bifidobacterium sp. B4114]